MTNADWKVLPVYIAPLDDPACVSEDVDGNANSSACGPKPECADKNANVCPRPALRDVPADWTLPDFDDSHWQNASLYAAQQVTNSPGYVDYATMLSMASFIWSPNLDLDNEVLARYTVEGPQ